MIKTFFKLTSSIFLIILCCTGTSYAYKDIKEQHIEVAMRMIGNEVLLLSGDYDSRVLPIEKEDGRYKIQFENNFQLDPESLIYATNKVFKKTKIASSYIVEVEHYLTKKIVYSFEVDLLPGEDLLPCRTRDQPLDCYVIYITFVESFNQNASILSLLDPDYKPTSNEQAKEENASFILLVVLILLSLGLFFYFFNRKKKVEATIDPDMISIGQCVFDKRNLVLTYNDVKKELTSKESDLLLILFGSANKVLERDQLLNMVWGDEGDYIGRTLDVFISKLRKKLSDDTSLKIVNVRGVGYKFVVN